MYNRYLSNVPAPDPPAQMQKHPNHSNGSGAGLAQLFGGRLQLDADTVIALAVIWFLLSDGEIVQTDVFIIVAVLFLLGL